MQTKKDIYAAFLSVLLGVIISGLIVTTIMLTGIEAFHFMLKDIK